ncbi:hypothetical protein ABWH92_06895 [Ahrensia marina]|jgi:hypothetical protein|uniref:COG3904 family protein n=1 Tax=Ahrensia marina TaxID=1514904 RepID=UPI0035CF801D
MSVQRLTALLAGAAAMISAMVTGPVLAQNQAPQPIQPMRFLLVDNDIDCPACRYIRAVGDIEDFTAAQFRDFVKAYRLEGQGLTVVFSSPGGDVIAGLRLGREIREQGFNTQVGFPQRLPRGGYTMRSGDCASACTFAFLGGVERYAEDDVIGVHRFYPGNLEPDNRVVLRPGDEAVAAMIKVYALDMGVDDTFIDMSLDVPPADMRYLSNDELRDYAVVNAEGPIPLVAQFLEADAKGSN